MLFEKLREHCRDCHESLHVHPLLTPLQSEITREQYHLIIAMFAAAYKATEAQKQFTHLPDAPVMQWLHDDMDVHNIKPFPWKAEALSLANQSAMVGYLYVKQGSGLGGQLISRHLDKHLGLKPGTENFYFHGYGSDTGQKWREFKARVESIQDELDEQSVLKSAFNAFESIRKCADRVLLHV